MNLKKKKLKSTQKIKMYKNSKSVYLMKNQSSFYLPKVRDQNLNQTKMSVVENRL